MDVPFAVNGAQELLKRELGLLVMLMIAVVFARSVFVHQLVVDLCALTRHCGVRLLTEVVCLAGRLHAFRRSVAADDNQLFCAEEAMQAGPSTHLLKKLRMLPCELCASGPTWPFWAPGPFPFERAAISSPLPAEDGNESLIWRTSFSTPLQCVRSWKKKLVSRPTTHKSCGCL